MGGSPRYPSDATTLADLTEAMPVAGPPPAALVSIPAPMGVTAPVIGYASPSAPGRLTRVLVLGIVGLVVGGLGWVMGALLLNVASKFSAMRGLVATTSPYWDSIIAWQRMAAAGYLILGCAVIVASVGALRRSRWAWSAMVGYAALHLTWLAVRGGLVFTWLIPTEELLAGYVSAAEIRAHAILEQAIVTGIEVIFPAVVLVMFTRPVVRGAFGRERRV